MCDLPFSVQIVQSSVEIAYMEGQTAFFTGTFGANWVSTDYYLDQVYEYVQFSARCVGNVTLTSWINLNGLFAEFPSCYGTGLMTAKMCGQIITRPVFYPGWSNPFF